MKEIEFGRYPQGRRGEIKPIKWFILKRKKSGEVVLISRNILFSDLDDSSTTYINSFLRKWLNNDFYNEAFNDDEKEVVLTSEIENKITDFSAEARSLSMIGWNGFFQMNDLYDLVSDRTLSNTQDKIFALAPDEIDSFFKSKDDRKSTETAYSRTQGEQHRYEYNNCWALRMRGSYRFDDTCYVNEYGEIKYSYDDIRVGVRPVMKVDLALWERNQIQKEELRIAEEKRQEELRIAEEKRQEELKLAEQKRLEELRIAVQRRQEWKSLGLCQYCGGKFKGLIFKKCSCCRRKKDYKK